MSKVTLDNREVKIGDKLWSCVYGWGFVNEVNSSVIHMTFEFFEDISFWDSGAMSLDHLRTLFWNEINMTPPAPPKKLVRKWRWYFKTEDREKTGVSTRHFASEEEFEKRYPSYKAIQKIDSTMIEVEG